MSVSVSPLYVRAVGMACPVGLRWVNACAAMRAGIDRKYELPYCDNAGQPIVGSRLSVLDPDASAEQRWLALLSYALKDATAKLDRRSVEEMPIVLALPSGAASDSPSIAAIAQALSASLRAHIDPRYLTVVTEGAPGGFRAIALAREIARNGRPPGCMVAGADSLVNARSVLELSERRRLLTEDNSDGVIPGEAAACLLVARSKNQALAAVRGLGFAREAALLSNDVPLRGDGLTAAARAALEEAGMAMHDMDFRLSDAAGESYSFKEQSLMVTKLLRKKKETFPLWMSADTLGDTGAAAGLCGLASAIAGFQRGYAPGPRAIACAGNDQGQRAAVVLEAVTPA